MFRLRMAADPDLKALRSVRERVSKIASGLLPFKPTCDDRARDCYARALATYKRTVAAFFKALLLGHTA